MNYLSERRDNLGDIINLLIEFGNGNFAARGEVIDSDDPFNAIMSGMNMLGEELLHFENELKSQKQFLQNILSSIDEVIYARRINLKDPFSSPFIFVNARFEEIMGFSNQELFAQPDKWVNAIHPEDSGIMTYILQNTHKGKESVVEYRIYNPRKKEYRWLEDCIVPKKNSTTDEIIIFGSARDITDQIKSTVELRATHQLVSRIISSSDQFFYIVKVNSENTFINDFTYLSKQIEDIQGSSIKEIKASPLGWMKAIHPDDLEKVKEFNRLMFSTKKPVLRVYRVKHAKTGEYIWLEDYVSPVTDEDGGVIELYGSVRNINRRKVIELEKEQLIKELVNKNNELMQFNYIVSHNLRAPVANILGLAQLLQTNLSEKEHDETNRYILQASQAMDELLHDLNSILSSRSMLNEKKETFRIKDIIRNVRNNLRREIDNTHAIINTDIQPDADEINSIKSYIQSSLLNLIGNAIKYTADGCSPIINITVYRLEGNIIIKVQDNGIGIDLSAHSSKIFGLYSRLNLEREGKGLGLYMTKTQIESLGGNITVESEPGKGSVFTIILPAT